MPHRFKVDAVYHMSCGCKLKRSERKKFKRSELIATGMTMEDARLIFRKWLCPEHLKTIDYAATVCKICGKTIVNNMGWGHVLRATHEDCKPTSHGKKPVTVKKVKKSTFKEPVGAFTLGDAQRRGIAHIPNCKNLFLFRRWCNNKAGSTY